MLNTEGALATGAHEGQEVLLSAHLLGAMRANVSKFSHFYLLLLSEEGGGVEILMRIDIQSQDFIPKMCCSLKRQKQKIAKREETDESKPDTADSNQEKVEDNFMCAFIIRLWRKVSFKLKLHFVAPCNTDSIVVEEGGSKGNKDWVWG